MDVDVNLGVSVMDLGDGYEECATSKSRLSFTRDRSYYLHYFK
jgi:hypothetical protein